ncbi:MAG: thiamine diphosphokinase [Oscillospiraceae bacterium]|nr:thiamine diphosphokinase [Oscillospiraceae bacterium]
MTYDCLILSGGEYCAVPENLRQAGFIIACDRGWEYAGRFGIEPDLIVGDFDSSVPPKTGIAVKVLPTRKDDTDTMYAVRTALEKGCRKIAIACAFGGRLDHTIANLQSAAYVVSHGGECHLIGEDTEAFVFPASRKTFPRHEGWSLSLFALSDVCTGVTIEGTKFDCEGVTMTNAFPLGVSNVWASEEAVVSVESGIMMVVQSRLKKGEHI